MGRGGGRGGAKHSKNNCAGATSSIHVQRLYRGAEGLRCVLEVPSCGSVFTNYERAKDKGSEGYGTVKTRLGGDSIKVSRRLTEECVQRCLGVRAQTCTTSTSCTNVWGRSADREECGRVTGLGLLLAVAAALQGPCSHSRCDPTSCWRACSLSC
eukprot:2642028-Rhodomonas_salina.5